MLTCVTGYQVAWTRLTLLCARRWEERDNGKIIVEVRLEDCTVVRLRVRRASATTEQQASQMANWRI